MNLHFPSISPNPVSKVQLTCHLFQEASLDLYIACGILRSLLFWSLLYIPTPRLLGGVSVCVGSRAHSGLHVHTWSACSPSMGESRPAKQAHEHPEAKGCVFIFLCIPTHL